MHRRSHQLKQAELAHLIGVSAAMIHRMEQGVKAQIGDVEAMLALEIVFGKPIAQIFAAIHVQVEEAVMRRAAELEAVWRTLDDPKSRANLTLLNEIMARVKVTPDAA